MKWENITVRNNDYIKVKSIKVIIPLYKNTQFQITDDFEFISSDPELIHVALNSNAIVSSLDFNDWAQYLKKLLLRKNLPIIVKCVFEHWDCFNVSFDIADFKICSNSEIKKYVYIQQEKQFEFSKGNLNYAIEKYTSLSERKGIFGIK